MSEQRKNKVDNLFSTKINYAVEVLLTTNIWVFLYNNLLGLLNNIFPVVPKATLSLNATPKPFIIPFYLITTVSFVLILWLIHKIPLKLPHLPFVVKVSLLIFLLVIFIMTLGNYPLAGQYDPYPLRANQRIYTAVTILFLITAATMIAFSAIIERFIKNRRWLSIASFCLIVLIFALLTFDARFPMSGHDYEYFLGPVWEVVHGKTIYTDITSQYAFLYILFFSLLYKLHLLSLFYLPFIIWIFYIIEFLLCFFLIKKISKSVSYSLLGTFSIMTLSYFSLFHLPSVIPQAGPLRWLPPLLLIVSFYKFKKLDSEKFIALTVFLSLFVVDTGIAILMTYTMSIVIFFLRGVVDLKKIIKSLIMLCLNLIGIAVIINMSNLLLGYKYIDILGLVYNLKKHIAYGLTMQPISYNSYFWVYILIYFATVIYFLKKKNVHFEDQLTIFTANTSLFISVYFLGNAHPHNLFHIALFPLLTLFLLIGLGYKVLSTKKKLIISIVLFFILISLPAYYRRYTLTEMLLIKYQGIIGNKIFQSGVEEIINTRYDKEIKLIKNNIQTGSTIILSSDDTYLYLATGKRNLLDADPIMGIDVIDDLNFAVKTAIIKCPKKIAIDCSFIGKCPPYTPFIGPTFNVKLIQDKIEKSCGFKYKPTNCTNQLCIAEARK